MRHANPSLPHFSNPVLKSALQTSSAADNEPKCCCVGRPFRVGNGMQRATRISGIYILVFCLMGAASVPAENSIKQARAEVAARKAAAAKAADKAKVTAKAVQKAQETSVTQRIEADKRMEIANADKAKLTAGLARNARQKELEKLTRTAQKSAEAARKAQEEADKAVADVQVTSVAARQAEVEE